MCRMYPDPQSKFFCLPAITVARSLFAGSMQEAIEPEPEGLIFMVLSFGRQLLLIILLTAVFLVPLASAAHSLDTGTMEDTHGWHLLQEHCSHESNDNHDKEAPCDGTGDCCDEECCHDAAEPPFQHAVTTGAPTLKRLLPYSLQIPPKVYLAIFVPPEA